MTNRGTAIAVDRLCVYKGKQEIIKSLSVELEIGKIHGLLGPSGGGKTTLMRTILGLQQYESGSVSVYGLAAGSKRLRDSIGYSTQAASIYSDLTVGENIRFFAQLHSTNELSQNEILTIVDLTDKRNQIASSLSGGERARLALATTLVGKPSLIVLDEPTVGLDPLLRIQIWTSLRNLAKLGKTLLISSHIMDEATNCDNIVLLRDGALLATGSPTDLLKNSNSENMESAFIHYVQEVNR